MLNRIIVNITAVACVASATLAGAVANAAPIVSASATASFLGVELSGLDAVGNSYLVDASTPFSSGFDVALTPFSFNSTTPWGVSVAQIDDTFAPLPGTSAAAEIVGEGHASALWSLEWIATTTGPASINLDYLYDATIKNLNPGDHALARSYASLMLEGTGLQDSALYYLNDANGNLFDFRTLSLSFDVTKGDTGVFTMTLASDAVTRVPEPSTLPLLCSALAGIFVVRRKRRLAR